MAGALLHLTSYILHLTSTSYTLHLTSHISHLASHIYILHLTSHILRLTSYISHPTSYVLRPTSYILHLTSHIYISHLTSYILYLISHILYLLSYILHPTSCITSSQTVARAFDRVISKNAYPLTEAENSNARHRPIGIGVQGLADAFAMLRLPFESAEASELNKAIFETLYFGALQASNTLARELGAYPTFPGSPASEGVLQCDLWGVTPSERWEWPSLRHAIAQHGLRNSLLIAPMPTASTAQASAPLI